MTKEKQQKQLTINDLDFFYMPNGLPCFLGNKENLIDIIEEQLNLSMYYLLADKATYKKYTQHKPATYEKGVSTPAKTVEYTEQEREICMFKIVKNMIGRIVQPADDCFGETFIGIEPEAIYNLPPIPKSLTDKLDEFFRLVHAQHGTESIVLLTFDESNMTSESWGVLVPKQENTSVHCKYDPDSVVELKPYHLSIVGSVHSHPEMSAYASGTDHEDQADFDGLHITYGWQKSKDNGSTQYHIEMQMAGTAYILKPEDVFETEVIIKEPDPEVVSWTENVSKKSQPPYSATGVTQQQPYLAPQNSKVPALATTPTYIPPIGPRFGRYRTLLKSIGSDISLAPDAILVVEVQDNYTQHCPICDYALYNVDITNRVCGGCEVHLSLPLDTAYEIIGNVTYHESMKFHTGVESTYSATPDNEDFNHIYLFCKDVQGNPMFLHIYDNGSVNSLDHASKDQIDSLPVLLDPLETDNFTLCCNVHIDRIADECGCTTTVTIEDAIDFENQYGMLDLYEKTSDCFECKHYMQATCPLYRKIIVDWANDKIEPTDAMIFDICEHFHPYLDSHLHQDIYKYDNDKASLYYD